MTSANTQPLQPQHHAQLKPRRRWPRYALAGIGAVALIGIGAGIGASASSTPAAKTVYVPKTVVRDVPGPVVYKTRTVTKPVPGPTVYKTKTVYQPASNGPAGTTIGTWSGSGTSVTPAFSVPASGDYVVSWTFSGNDSGGTGGDNFIVNLTGSNSFTTSLPNLIQASGSGSTEVTGDSGSDSFNVQSDQTCNWTIKVVSAT